MILNRYTIGAIVIAAGFAAALWAHRLQVGPVGVPVVAKPAKALNRVGTERVNSAPLKVYKPAAKRKLKLPDTAPTEHVIASTTVRPDYHPHTVSTVVDTATGEATTYDMREPLPWVALDSRGEAGAALGLHNGEPAVRVDVRQNLLNVKALVVSLDASVDVPLAAPTKPDTFIGVGIRGRW